MLIAVPVLPPDQPPYFWVGNLEQSKNEKKKMIVLHVTYPWKLTKEES